MLNKVQETQLKLKEYGYYAPLELAKIVYLFESAGKKNRKGIVSMLLEGKSGAGKTFLGETFSKMINPDDPENEDNKKFVQCFPRMGAENFQCDVNIVGVIKHDADNSIKPGILLQALQQSHERPVVLIIDELDKARGDVDSFLLDFLENGRLTTGTDTYKKGEFPIYTFITSNSKREIDEALINRSRRVNVPRPSKELFLEILGLPVNHYLSIVYDKCPDFSIRQAKQYLEDIEELGVDFDEDAISQYVNIDNAKIETLEDLEIILDEAYYSLRPELHLDRCTIKLDSKNQVNIMKLLNEDKEGNFKLYSNKNDEENFHIEIETLKQLKIARKYIELGHWKNEYSGWFKCTKSDSEIKEAEIMWAVNTNRDTGDRFGLLMNSENNKLFRIVSHEGNAFVYLDSTSYTIESFLNQSKNTDEKKNKEDSEYCDDEECLEE